MEDNLFGILFEDFAKESIQSGNVDSCKDLVSALKEERKLANDPWLFYNLEQDLVEVIGD